MKLELYTQPPEYSTTYGPGEAVCGHVDLHIGKTDRIPDVTLVFQGTMKLSLAQKPDANTFAQVPERAYRHSKTFTLFSHSVKQTPIAQPRTDSGLLHTVPFSFCFPTLAFCRSCTDPEFDPVADAFPLPPSLRFVSKNLDACVSYSVTATVRRKSRHLQLPRRFSARQVVAFSPGLSTRARAFMQPPLADAAGDASDASDASTIHTVDTVDTVSPRASLISTTSLLPCVAYDCKESPTILAPGCLPPYSPSMALELVMPQPPVIEPHGNIPLGIFLRTPSAMLDASSSTRSPIHLRSIRVRLRRDTVARFAVGGAVAEAAPTYWPLWSSEGKLPIRRQRLDLTALTCGGVWAAQSQVPDTAGPSFQTRFFSQIYSIEVRIEVSGASSSPAETSKVECIRASIEVDVADPPPGYSERSSAL